MRILENKIVSSYLDAIQKLIRVKHTDEGYLVIGPFTRPDGDYIEVEIIPQSDDKILLTDNAETLDYLFLQGLDTKREEFKRIISLICRQHNVEISQDIAYKISDFEKLGNALHQLIMAILTMSGLVHRKRLVIPAFRKGRFDASIGAYIERRRIRYVENYVIEGKLIPHCFRFYINEGRNILIQPLTATDEEDALNKAMRLGFEWIDISEKQPGYQKVAIIDTAGKKEAYWEEKPIKVLKSLSDKVILGTRLQELLNLIERE